MGGDDRPAQTQPSESVWGERTPGFRRWETSIVLGTGGDVWEWGRGEVLRWAAKTRSGFPVASGAPATAGVRPVIMAHAFGLSIREPVEVIEVVDNPGRAGFAYRTLPGHPVAGEEAFIVHRRADTVILTVRSLTRPAAERRWRVLYPALLVAQAVARRRYLRALRLRAPD